MEERWTGKNSKLGKKTCAEGGFCKVIHNFFFEHTWDSKMKFLPCREHILEPLSLKIFQPD